MVRGKIVWTAVMACLVSAGAAAQSLPARKVTGEVAVALAGAPSAEVSGSGAIAPLILAPVAPQSLMPAAPVPAAPAKPAPQVAAPLPAPVAAPAPKLEAVPVYRVRSGETLSEVLNRWVGRGGMAVVWKSSNDYRLAADAHFTGNLMAALEQLTEVVAKTSPALRVRMYANGVIVVTEGAE